RSWTASSGAAISICRPARSSANRSRDAASQAAAREQGRRERVPDDTPMTPAGAGQAPCRHSGLDLPSLPARFHSSFAPPDWTFSKDEIKVIIPTFVWEEEKRGESIAVESRL